MWTSVWPIQGSATLRAAIQVSNSKLSMRASLWHASLHLRTDAPCSSHLRCLAMDGHSPVYCLCRYSQWALQWVFCVFVPFFNNLWSTAHCCTPMLSSCSTPDTRDLSDPQPVKYSYKPQQQGSEVTDHDIWLKTGNCHNLKQLHIRKWVPGVVQCSMKQTAWLPWAHPHVSTQYTAQEPAAGLTESFESKGTFEGHPVLPPAVHRDTCSSIMLLRPAPAWP